MQIKHHRKLHTLETFIILLFIFYSSQPARNIQWLVKIFKSYFTRKFIQLENCDFNESLYVVEKVDYTKQFFCRWEMSFRRWNQSLKFQNFVKFHV